VVCFFSNDQKSQALQLRIQALPATHAASRVSRLRETLAQKLCECTDRHRALPMLRIDGVQRQRRRYELLEHFDQPPVLETALTLEGGGRSWSVVHSGSIEQFHHSVLALGGEVVESRDATLEEIFLARAGRSRSQVEAA